MNGVPASANGESRLQQAAHTGVIVEAVGPVDARLPVRSGATTATAEVRLAKVLTGLTGPPSSIDADGWQRALAAIAPATIAARAADLACYARFAAAARHGPLPAAPTQVAGWLDWLEPRYRPSTIARRLSSLAAAHTLLGLDDPTRSAIVALTTKGIRRRRGSAQRQAAPLRFGEAIDTHGTPGLTLSALLEVCGGDMQGLRDAALLSLGYDAGLRVAELTGAVVGDLEATADGSGVLSIPRSKTDQLGQGAFAWVSPDSMRRIRAWLDAAGIRDGPLFRRVGVDRRAAVKARRRIEMHELARNAKVDAARMAAVAAQPARIRYSAGPHALTRQGVTLIYRRVARQAANAGLVALFGAELNAAIAALSTHSLRVGLTQDLFAAGEDVGPIAQALRWRSTATALRYGAKLAPQSNAAARVLREVRR